jgi:hypothetical protein
VKFSSVDQIVDVFKRKGFHFSKWTLISSGKYHPFDSTWNYMDIIHAEFVHDQIDSDYGVISDKYLSGIAFIKLFGLQIPLLITNFSQNPHSMTYYMSWLFFCLIVETNAEEVRPGLTRVSTNYKIGSVAFFKFLHPCIKWILSKNYKVLMSTDVPMRERRGQLREWGYSFKDDSDHSFEKSLDNSKQNVIFPKENTGENLTIDLILDDILPSDGEFLYGRDDHFGVQIIRSAGFVSIYPRLCSHEGASLDKDNFWVCSRRREVPVSNQKGYKIMCPWHGKLHEPIGQFDLSSKEIQKMESVYLSLSMKDRVLSIDKK